MLSAGEGFELWGEVSGCWASRYKFKVDGQWPRIPTRAIRFVGFDSTYALCSTRESMLCRVGNNGIQIGFVTSNHPNDPKKPQGVPQNMPVAFEYP